MPERMTKEKYTEEILSVVGRHYIQSDVKKHS